MAGVSIEVWKSERQMTFSANQVPIAAVFEENIIARTPPNSISQQRYTKIDHETTKLTMKVDFGFCGGGRRLLLVRP